MAELHEVDPASRKTRAMMSVAAALCVLGFASLVWLHDSPGVGATATGAPLFATDTQSLADDLARAPASTGVPSAESVFRDWKYTAPEEPIAQF
jgi:hypothetical protein